MATKVSNATAEPEQINYEKASSLFRLSRAECARIAEDTLNKLELGWYVPHKGFRISLEDDIRFCNDNSVLYTEYDLQNTTKLSSTITETHTKIEVRQCTTLQAARSLAAEMGEDHVGVLNFASAKNPGGGFLGGSQAQEESIARSSSLYLALTQPRIFNGFYEYNRYGRRGIYSHRMIYSPRVTIFKDDNGKVLSSPYHVGIVSVPAPNAGVMNNAEAARNAMAERVKRLLYVFEANKHDCLVLGAFGCGVFKNDPFEVATIFRQHLESNDFKNSFKRIIFAVCSDENYQLFRQVFAATDFNKVQQPVTATSLDADDNRQYSWNTRNRQYKNNAKRNNRFEQGRYTTSTNYGNQEDDNE